jgi:hypothetical protein
MINKRQINLASFLKNTGILFSGITILIAIINLARLSINKSFIISSGSLVILFLLSYIIIMISVFIKDKKHD